MFNLNAVLNVVGANTASVRAAVSDINNEMDRGTRKARNFADAVALQGTKLGAYTAASLAVIKLTESISAATRDAIRFEVEMVKVAQTVGISTEEAKKHGEEIRNLSVLYGLSAPKIAETVKILGQAGYTLRQAKEAADSLAQTTLLASFESISDTTDGLIAVNKQFIDTVGKSAEVLSVFNIVSKKYAVESSDLVEVVRKAGGTFSATGGSLEELLAVFTTVRDTTRESAETIAVGLRTIFSRLQRPKTIEYLKQFGIELVNLEGQFVGNFEAIQRIQKGLDAFGVRPGSIQFAQVVEQIGGVLQQSRVIPLLTQGAKLQQVYADAQTATSQTAIDLAKAQDTLSFKIAQTQQNFAKLIGDIAGSKGFDTLARGVISITNAMIGFGSAIKDVIPLISALLAFNLAKSVGRLSIGGIGGLTGKKFASGGFVPGSGNGDTVPAMLTPGEFVIRKSAAQALGAETLHGINKYAKGGPVSASDLKGVSLKKRVLSPNSRAYKSATDKQFRDGMFLTSTDTLQYDIEEYGVNSKEWVGKSYKDAKGFENFVKSKLGKNYQVAENPTAPVDILKSTKKGSEPFLEVRNRTQKTPEYQILSKFLRSKDSLPANSKLTDKNVPAGTIRVVYNTEKLENVKGLKSLASINNKKKPVKKASGGSISGTDTVPALLTPGEFVVNKKSAQAFGYGNLHKVNKYATGGVVGAQRFASGGVVGANSLLPGLEGLGDLAIVVNQLIPALGNATASFAAISVQGALLKGTFSGIRSVASGVSDFVTAYRAENKRLRDAQEEATNNVTLITGELRAAKVALASEVSAISSPAKSNKVTSEATAIAKSSVSGQSSQKITGAEKSVASSDIKAELKNIALAFTSSGGKLSPEYLAAVKLIKDLNVKTGNVITDMSKLDLKSTAEALKKYTAAVKTGAPAQTEVVEALKVQARAARKAASEATRANSIISSLKRGSASVASSPQGRELLSTAATAGVAALAARASGAANAAQKLSEAAVASGNSQEAYTNSLNASAEQQKATAIEQGASVGAAIGSLFGPMGTAIGTVIGGFLGLTGAITAFTDFLGLTNSEADAKIKAQEQERSAALVKADKISSAALTKSSDIRKFNPKAADAILLKGVRDFIDNNDAESSIANKDLQDQAKALFDAASSSIEELSQKSENVGKSFAQLRAENRDVFLAWQESGEIIEGNKERMLAQQRQHDAVAQLSAKEIRAREDAIAVLLQQIGIQERVNQSLLRMDRVANAQKDLIGQLDIALGGGLSSREIGSDLTNMDSTNTNSDAFKRGLDAVSRIGPEFAQTSNDISRTISAVRGIGTTVTQKKNLTADQIKEDILDDLKLKGLSPSIIKSIDSAIDGMGDNIDASAIESVILDKAVKPLAEGLEPARKAINEQLDNQLTILKKLSEIDQNRLAIALSGFEASLKTIRSIDKILGVEADPMFERGARLTRGSINLQGTSLQNMPLTGQARDISRIANQIKQNELKKLDIERRIGEADPNTKFGLQQEFTDLASETDKLKAAMIALSDVNEENAALEEKLAKSRANREAVRGAATDLAFGTNKDRRQFFKTLNQARGVAFTGSAEIVNPEDRGAVKSFLTTFKNLPAFAGGQTGQQVLDNATRNYLVNQVGVPLDQVDLVMKDFTRSEMDTVELIRENLTIDEKRNDLLGKILEAVSRDVGFNAPNMALPRRGQAGPFLGLAGFATGGKASENSSKIFKPKGSDTVPAMLTPGEFIVSAKYAKRNMRVLTEINSGSTKYAFGGMKVEYHADTKKPVAGYGHSTTVNAYGHSTTANPKAAIPGGDDYLRRESEAKTKIDGRNTFEQKQRSDEETKNQQSRNILVESAIRQKAKENREEAEKEARDRKIAIEHNRVQAAMRPSNDRNYPEAPTNNQETPAEAAANESAKRSYDAVKAGGTLTNTPSMTPRERLRPEDLQKNKDNAKAAEILAQSNIASPPQPKMTGEQLVAADDNKSGQIGTNSLLAFKRKNNERIVAEFEARSKRPAPKTLFGASTSDETPYARDQRLRYEDAEKQNAAKAAAAVRAKQEEQLASDKRMGLSDAKPPDRRPKTIAQLQEQQYAIGDNNPVTKSQASRERLEKRQDKQRERIDKRIDKLKGRAEKTRGDRGEERLQGLFNPQAPQLSPQAQTQVINEYGPTNSRPRVLQPGSPPPMPNPQSQASSNPAGFISGGRFSQALQGASGPPTGQTGQASQDFSSLTSSLEAFNTGFSTSVKQLIDMPKEFKHTITMPTMSITLNGAEFIAKLPEEMKAAILEQITDQTPIIIQKATAEITGGGLKAFVAGGKNSTRPAKT